jgi:hypothetical protein
MEESEAPIEKHHYHRRRREHGEPHRGWFVLPHLVTTAGLFFGFYAIVQAFNDKPDLAALGIVLAAVCDAFDGRLARLTRSTSRFGLEYDSIADTVSFGVAPAMLAFSAGHLQVLGRTGWVMAFVVRRLPARFRPRVFDSRGPRRGGHRNRGPADGDLHPLSEFQGDRPAPLLRDARVDGFCDRVDHQRAERHVVYHLPRLLFLGAGGVAVAPPDRTRFGVVRSAA